MKRGGGGVTDYKLHMGGVCSGLLNAEFFPPSCWWSRVEQEEEEEGVVWWEQLVTWDLLSWAELSSAERGGQEQAGVGVWGDDGVVRYVHWGPRGKGRCTGTPTGLFWHNEVQGVLRQKRWFSTAVALRPASWHAAAQLKSSNEISLGLFNRVLH